MADTLDNWSTTAASNSNSDSAINMTEGQLPGTLNNGVRALMGRVSEWNKDLKGITTTGTTSALAVTTNRAYTTFTTDVHVRIKAHNTPLAGATLNHNTTGAKSIRTTDGAGNDVAISAGMICTGGIYDLVSSTALNAAAGGWWLLNPSNVTVGGGFPSCILSKTYDNSATVQISGYADWVAVPLDTEEFDDAAVMTLAANRFTSTVNGGVKARVSVAISGSAVTFVKIRLQNITDGTTTKGSNIVQNSSSADNVAVRQHMDLVTKIVAGKQYELQIRGVRVSGTGAVSYAALASLDNMGDGIPISVEFYRT